MRAWLTAHRCTAAAYLALVIALVIGMARVELLARSTHEVLCDFKADVERRAQNTRDFLDANPNGIPGLSAAPSNAATTPRSPR